MHELSICRKIVEIVAGQIAPAEADAVAEIGIRVGVLSGVDPDALAFAFESISVDTPVAGASLSIERIPLRGECRSCGTGSEIEDYLFRCPACGSDELSIVSGEELEIAYIQERASES